MRRGVTADGLAVKLNVDCGHIDQGCSSGLDEHIIDGNLAFFHAVGQVGTKAEHPLDIRFNSKAEVRRGLF